MPARFVCKKGPTGKFRFVLVAPNGQVIAVSETYESKAAAMNGIKSVKRFAADAPVEDMTTAPAMAKSTARATKAPAKKAPSKPKGMPSPAP